MKAEQLVRKRAGIICKICTLVPCNPTKGQTAYYQQSTFMRHRHLLPCHFISAGTFRVYIFIFTPLFFVCAADDAESMRKCRRRLFALPSVAAPHRRQRLLAKSSTEESQTSSKPVKRIKKEKKKRNRKKTRRRHLFRRQHKQKRPLQTHHQDEMTARNNMTSSTWNGIKRATIWSRMTMTASPYLLLILFIPATVVQCQMAYETGRDNGNNRMQQPQQRNSHCEEWQFECKDGQNCIARYDQCDGIEQCPDGSDEEDCRHRHERPNNYQMQPPQQQHQEGSSRIAEGNNNKNEHKQHQTQPPTNAHAQQKVGNSSNNNNSQERHLPMRLLLIGASAFVIVAVVVHVGMKVQRRKKCAGRGVAMRGFRKGESLIDDEDDLLISQAYS